MPYKDANINRDKDGKLFVNKPRYKELKERISEQESSDKYLHFYSKQETNEEFINRLSVIVAASIRCDGLHVEEERIVSEAICQELEIDWDMFSKKIDEEISRIEGIDFKSIEKYLLKFLESKTTENSMVLFEAALHIILSDGVMTDNECNLLASIGNILDIPTAKMFARIGLFLREEKDVLVDTADNFDWLYESNQDYYY